eukprot:1545522-Amphidinium_carterae.1
MASHRQSMQDRRRERMELLPKVAGAHCLLLYREREVHEPASRSQTNAKLTRCMESLHNLHCHPGFPPSAWYTARLPRTARRLGSTELISRE